MAKIDFKGCFLQYVLSCECSGFGEIASPSTAVQFLKASIALGWEGIH